MSTQHFCPKCESPLKIGVGEMLECFEGCYENYVALKKDCVESDKCDNCSTIYHDSGKIIRFTEEEACKLCKGLFHFDADFEKVKRGEK